MQVLKNFRKSSRKFRTNFRKILSKILGGKKIIKLDKFEKWRISEKFFKNSEEILEIGNPVKPTVHAQYYCDYCVQYIDAVNTVFNILNVYIYTVNILQGSHNYYQ